MAINAVEAYKRAWELYRKNLSTYLISALVLAIVTLIVVVPVMLLHLGLFLFAMPATQMNPLMPPLVIAADIAVLLVAVLFSGIFKGAYFGVCHDIMEEEKITWSRLFHWVKIRWQSFAGITLLQLIAVMLVMVPFMVVGFLAGNALNSPFITPIIILLSIPFVMLLSSAVEFAFPKTVAEFTGAVESVSGAFGLVKETPAQFLLLVVITLLLGILAAVPFIGQLVITPIQYTAFSLFYLSEKKPKRRK